MQTSRIWQCLAALFCFSLLYIGHGMHRGNDALPPLVGTAQAGGVAVSTLQGAGIYTASEDGSRLFYWHAGKDGAPRYVGKADVVQKTVNPAASQPPGS
jgi:hypothetical protein